MPSKDPVTMSPESRELLNQYLTMWRRFTDDHGGADRQKRPGLALRWTDSLFPFWNMIFLDEEGIGTHLLQDRLQDAASYMRGRTGMGFVNLFEEQLDDAARAALPAVAERAFALSQHAMAGDILPMAEPDHAELRFERVRTDEHLQAYADLNSQGYGFPLEAGRTGLVGSTLWKSDQMHAYLALRGDTPVACAATVADEGNLFLALVATAPGFQRRGYATAVVRKALHEGGRATGLTRATLHASDAGFPVYSRIGYRKVGTIRTYGLQSTS
ncbi:MAG TPA: GNAT family N-acetyltransferase [Aliidongia sp.]|nr:GNAT family N-acetyltransferase [Aliidongia sp.]